MFSAALPFVCNMFEFGSLWFAIISKSAATVARTTVSVALTTVSYTKSARARQAVREPPGMLIGCCLSLAGHLFFEYLLEAFFHKNDTQGSLNGAIWEQF